MQTFSLPLKDSDSAVLLQLTDTHLHSTDEGSLLGVQTNQSFRAVLDEIDAKASHFDALLATGDISQDHSAASYQHFVAGISRWTTPCFWLPGNHDFKPNMYSVYPTPAIDPSQQVLVGEHWQLVLLDSQVKGVPHGELSEAQLEHLRNALRAHPNRHALVLLHHHPLEAGSAWLDHHRLHNAEAFWDVISEFPTVKGVLFGHIHQEMDRLHNGVRIMATPSTCFQFKPDSNDFGLDNQTPGWRWLTLKANGDIETKVERLPGKDYLPDFNSAGY
ncbi:3',5'-cyclic-AMP phosphodiesterase [Thaumasiovibrio subtropicus]|uniref:3',5'-cyclic-AMP phosphodiesterase n=1 Tax=Thaumasiovibrio subtropicus TaxID=1891207 RepID=UPI000B351C0B|nr:3',5'-cyclic-AMP phosphodiesterase [Thaumasiovibrio subtropicus]